MNMKKVNGTVIGATLSKNEQKGMLVEIRRQTAEYNRKNLNEIDAMVLWVLHEQFGFGPKRLKKFYECFNMEYLNLCDRYEMGFEDNAWLCMEKLKEIGVDIEAWNKQRGDS